MFHPCSICVPAIHRCWTGGLSIYVMCGYSLHLNKRTKKHLSSRDLVEPKMAGSTLESFSLNMHATLFRRSSPSRRTASGVFSDDDTPVSVSTHPSTDGSDPVTLRTLDGLDFNNEQEVRPPLSTTSEVNLKNASQQIQKHSLID